MQSTNRKVDDYFTTITQWRQELEQLRAILLDCQLTEELKWRSPCYTFQKQNIAILGGFKAYCALSFFKGALLQDTHGLLVSPGENSQSGRLFKFTDVKQIVAMAPQIKAYIYEAIEVEKAGVKVAFKQNKDLMFPEELQQQLKASPGLKSAFEALTPGRQRGYNLYFSAPKQSKTRTARIEKYRQRILDGKGINDCICGRSKKLPQCDGSHKYI